MHNLRLTEFDNSRNVDSQKALVFQSETCKCNVILGTDILTKTDINMSSTAQVPIQCFENEVPLRVPHTFKDKDYVAMAEMTAIQQEVVLFGMDWYDSTCYAIKIFDAKYKKGSY